MKKDPAEFPLKFIIMIILGIPLIMAMVKHHHAQPWRGACLHLVAFLCTTQ